MDQDRKTASPVLSSSSSSSSPPSLLLAVRLLENCGVTREMIVGGIELVQSGLSSPLEVFDNLESEIATSRYRNREEQRGLHRALKLALRQTYDDYSNAIKMIDLERQDAPSAAAGAAEAPPALTTPPQLSRSSSEECTSLQRSVHILKDSGITHRMILDGIRTVKSGDISVLDVSESLEKSILASRYKNRDEKRVILRALKLVLRQNDDDYLKAVEFLEHNSAPEKPAKLPTRTVNVISPAATGRREMPERLWGNEIGRGYLYQDGIVADASIEIREATWLPHSSNGRDTQRNGIFALKSFKTNEKITPYAGVGRFVDHEIFKFPALTSHFRTLQKINNQYYVIDGFRQPRVGFGLGQFANDRRQPEAANARIEVVDSENTGAASFNRMGAYLVAKRNIVIGEEILLDYGNTYWKNADYEYSPKLHRVSSKRK